MLNIKQNKRADKLISVFWFAILGIVAGGIFAMVYIYYGAPYDVRDIESNLLINKLADCISYGGRINSEILSGGNFSWSQQNLDKCNIILNSDEWEEIQFYAQIDFYKLENMATPTFSIKEGNNKWLASCEVQEEKERERLAKCNEGKFYSLDEKGNQYIIKILTAVRKAEKNVKI